MAGHFEQERALQERMERELGGSMPDVDILDVELDLPHEVVRVFVDRAGGVDHGVCANVTMAVRDTCPQYSLEVSSPGSERPLRRREHFERAQGSRVRIRRQGVRRAFHAQLLGADDDGITVRREDGTEQHIPFAELVRTRLAPAAGDATMQPTAKGSS